ncbi:cytochrome c family protein [Caldovatus sediminis]|uniref:Cytochrome c family protein n=1 Tax=Caldovatus sediminis TaxID=2041189 RepID=A0A8J3EDH1_9PROT|nr:cytochrome c family protein [Caldovatus sediminis]GGG42973.1 cytochrome c family protein [Caldovatus sediminis]
MDSMELNKILAAILTAGVAFGVAGFIGRMVVHPTMPHESAIRIGEPAATQVAQPAAPAAPALEPITPLLASADPQNGEALARRLCAACHTFNEGGRSGVGPNLYGIVGAPHAHVQGFNYSAALRAKEGPWTYEELNAWLANPRAYAPGNRMAFAGMANAQQRADLIAYLRSISPGAPAPEAAAAGAPAR